MQEIDIFVFMKYQQHADLLYLAITSIKICSSIVNFFYQYCDRQVQEIQAQNIQYTTSVSMIILSGRTYSSQNVRQIWESTLSKSYYLVGHESGYLKIFFTFLEVNISNILWSMRICKRTFFPVCRMSGYVNTQCISTLHHIRARKGTVQKATYRDW